MLIKVKDNKIIKETLFYKKKRKIKSTQNYLLIIIARIFYIYI